MKFERIGFIYAALALVCVVIFIPISGFAVVSLVEYTSRGIAFIINAIRGTGAQDNVALFSRALMYSFTVSFIVLLGISKLVEHIKLKKNDNSIEKSI